MLAALFAAGCASAPPAKRAEGSSPAAGEQAARTALSMIGRPYKYRGDSPAGFDCSGLVKYSYRIAGVKLPHGTKHLLPVTRPVPRNSIRKGDLVFFLQEGRRYSHVGIAVDRDRFVHAPSSGKTVRTDSLTDPYWKKHLIEARRLI